MTTVARGLVTLKHNKVKFTEDLIKSTFSGVFRNGVDVSTAIETKAYSETTRKNIQSFKDRINEEFNLRKKINKANFNTKIKVGDEEMSINDALTYKTHILPQLKHLYNHLLTDLTKKRNLFVDLENEYNQKLLNAKDDEEFKSLLEKRDKPTILNTEDEILELKRKIDFFDLEFDAILTEANPLIVLD